MGTSRVLIRAFQATSAATHCGEATNAFFIQWKVQVHASIRNVEAKLQFREACNVVGDSLVTISRLAGVPSCRSKMLKGRCYPLLTRWILVRPLIHPSLRAILKEIWYSTIYTPINATLSNVDIQMHGDLHLNQNITAV